MLNEQELKNSYRTLVIICVSIIMSLFIYAYVVDVIEEQNAPFSGFVPDFGDVQELRYALLALSIAILFAIRPLKRYVLTDRREGASRHGGPVPYGQYTSAHIVVYVMCESICICGLVLFLICGSKTDFYTFMPLSLVAMGYNFPKYDKMKKWALGMAGEAVPEDGRGEGGRGIRGYHGD